MAVRHLELWGDAKSAADAKPTAEQIHFGGILVTPQNSITSYSERSGPSTSILCGILCGNLFLNL